MRRNFLKLAAVAAMGAAALALSACATAPSHGGSGDGQDRHVKVINETRSVMLEFYASRVSTDDWEEDILGQDTLGVGQSVNINIDDGTGACLFDFKAVFADGDTLVRNRIDVCNIGTYRYTEN